MANLWGQFRGLFARDRAITVVTVQVVNSNGTSSVQTQSGATLTVIGDSITAGNKALVQQGRIIGQAASLPTYNVSV